MKSYKPTSPSRRQLTNVSYDTLSKVQPHKSLLKRLKTHAGRNSQGRITMRHQGGGHKKLYRIIDFKQMRREPAKVESIEYDPYRTAFIAKVAYPDGERRYILASHWLKVGEEVVSREGAEL